MDDALAPKPFSGNVHYIVSDHLIYFVAHEMKWRRNGEFRVLAETKGS